MAVTDASVARPGLDQSIVDHISQAKREPSWMHTFRRDAFATFANKQLPQWGPDLSALCLDDIYYYVREMDTQARSWDDVPDNIRTTFDALGIPKAEQSFLAGVGAQYESEVIYKRLRKRWAEQGVIFCDTETALKEHPELFKRYFATVVPPHDNKFAALNSAVWSGGSFVYVPAGVRIEQPLQAYFRINRAQMGQFERTLIIAEPGSFVHYVEGCSAPLYSRSSLHSAVVELIALPGAHIRYTTIQNWSGDVYNLVTKRAIAHEDATVEWIDGNFGSAVTMKYPCVVLKGARSRGQVISIAVAGQDQQLDAGAKMIHIGSDTSSNVISKSLSKQGGRASYRGLLRVAKTAHNARAKVQCDALMLDAQSQADTYPHIAVDTDSADIGHEASVNSISEQQLFYLTARGLTEQEARTLIVNGFIDVFTQMLPMEYAVEINRLIMHEMEGSVG